VTPDRGADPYFPRQESQDFLFSHTAFINPSYNSPLKSHQQQLFIAEDFLYTKLRNRLSIETMDMLLFIYINAWSLRKASGDTTDYGSKTKEEIQELLLNMEEDAIPDAVREDTQIVDEIDQEELARLAQLGEFTFLELDMDVVMASYEGGIPDYPDIFEGNLSSYFDGA
jgi:gas vesicle protein